MPLSILGAISIAAGLISILLPETRNRPLPETIEDGARLYAAKPVPRERMMSVAGELPQKYDLNEEKL